MKFPRNAYIFRGHLDAAPFASVFLLLVIFLMAGSLVYTPGVRLQLPVADDLSGTDKALGIRGGGRERAAVFREPGDRGSELRSRLSEVAHKSQSR